MCPLLCTYGDIKRAIRILNEYGNKSFTTLSQCPGGWNCNLGSHQHVLRSIHKQIVPFCVCTW